jgi:murein DD-endopeptidase MepM/ murein hydrolase activator NlpD
MNAGAFSPIVEFNAQRDKLLALDFTDANKELTHEVLNDIDKFSRYIDDRLTAAGALYGIGGYGEHRTIYSLSSLFDSEDPEAEPRRLHLGVDIWGKMETRVHAPLGASIHSFAYNDRRGDYGATIILSHELEGITFHTLYGHLDLDSINKISVGDRIEKGQAFAAFGSPEENGYWPPHLHFQLIADMDGYRGDYPGVCKFSERSIWLERCPDTGLILRW